MDESRSAALRLRQFNRFYTRRLGLRLDAARVAGCRRVVLWTNDVLVAARRIYESEGFKLVGSERHSHFDKPMPGQTWELDLPADRERIRAG